jgi:hypothetical protein
MMPPDFAALHPGYFATLLRHRSSQWQITYLAFPFAINAAFSQE